MKAVDGNVDLRAWRDTVTSLTGRTNLRFAITEYNGSFAQSRPVPYRHCLGNALVVAEHLRAYQQESDVFMAVHWQFANEYWGMIKSLGNEMVLRPTYWVFRLYGEHFGDQRIGAVVSVDRYETGGGYTVTKSAKFSEGSKARDWTTISADYFTLPDSKELLIQARCLGTGTGEGGLEMRQVRAQRFSSEESPAIANLGVAASIKNDGTICLIIVNKNMNSAYATSIEGVSAKGAKAWCLSGPSVDAVNEQVTNLVTVHPLTASWLDGKASVVLPPFSLTAVELR